MTAACADAGVAVLNAAPFGGGILVKGLEEAPRYAYRSAPDMIRDRVRKMTGVCADAGVPLAAAALQFSLREPRTASTVVGITRPERIAQLLEQATMPVPETLWPELEQYVPDSAHWLN